MTTTTFFTTQAAQNGIPNGISGKLPAGTGLQGANFVDIIMAYMMQNAQKSGQDTPALLEPEKHGVLESKNPLLTKTPGLKLAEIVANNAEIREQVKNFISNPESGLSVQDQILQTLMLNQNALDSTIAPLSDGVITTAEIENGSPRLLDALLIQDAEQSQQLLKRLQTLLENLESQLQASGEQIPTGLSLFNLSEAQITELKSKIASLLAGDGPSGNLDLRKLFPGASDKDILNILAHIQAISAGQVTEANLNGHGNKNGFQLMRPIAYPDDVYQPIARNPGETHSLPPAFQDVGKPHGFGGPGFGNAGFEQSGGQKNSNFSNQSSTMNGANNADVITARMATAQNLPSLFAEMVDSLEGGLQFSSDDTTRYQQLFSVGAGITGAHNLTSLTTQAPSASAPHPATQMVAASILKNGNAAAGERNILVQLDPPELGRVEIRLSFNKEKAVKAVVIAERGETVTMLQRDAHVLERALSSIGLSGEGAISFELAGDQHFDQNGRHDGSHQGGGRGHASSDDTDIIETTLNWYVDMATGHVRYNILA